MGINQVPIVNQYADINRRLTEIQQAGQSHGFRLPDGIWIITAADMRLTKQVGMFFVLRYDSMFLVRTQNSTGETLLSERGRAFIKYLMQYLPDLKFSEHEIVLGKEGSAWLKTQLGLKDQC